MIKASFICNSEQMIESFRLDGHAEYAEEGTDIVCSAVSALAQTIIYALVERHQLPAVKYNLVDGRIGCAVKYNQLNPEQQQIAKILLLALYDGIKQISDAYDGLYVHIDGGLI